MSTPRRSDVAESTTAIKTGAKVPRRGGFPRGKAALDQHTQAAMSWIPSTMAEDDQDFARRLGEWTDRLAPDGPVEHYLVERAVRASWQMDCADRRYTEMIRAAGDAPAPTNATVPVVPAGGYLDHQLGLGRMLLGALDTLGRLRVASRPRREKAARPRAGASRPRKSLPGSRTASLSIARSASADPSSATIAGLASALAMTQAVEPGWSSQGPVEIAPSVHPTGAGLEMGTGPSPSRTRPLTRRSADLLRRVGRDDHAMPAGSHPEKRANEPNLSRPLDASNPRIGANEPNGRRRIAAESWQNRANEPNAARRTDAESWQIGANEPNGRRRVGGYDVPLDSWDPGSKADHVPVRYRGTGRSLAGRLSIRPS